jgi:hypothetical protein
MELGCGGYQCSGPQSFAQSRSALRGELLLSEAGPVSCIAVLVKYHWCSDKIRCTTYLQADKCGLHHLGLQKRQSARCDLVVAHSETTSWRPGCETVEDVDFPLKMN